MDIYFIDGQFVETSKAVVSVKDLAVLRGYGVFDFLRTYGKRPFHLEDHLIRLQRSARLIGLPFPWSRSELAAVVTEGIERSPHSECNVRLLVTGGSSDDSITPGETPRLMVMVTDLHRLPSSWYEEGVKIITSHIDRLVPEAKSINYIPGILALRDAREQGAVEAVYVNFLGQVLEGTTSNFFGFMGDTLVTPERGILPGITRQVVLDLTRDVFPVEARPLHRNELRLLDEAFVTASNKEILPVVRIDSIPMGDGSVGDRTRRVMSIFNEYTRRYASSASGQAPAAE
ncbi:MAG: aminotransferase class IV [Desulfobacterales bacterium]